MAVAIYARVSTSDQTIEHQLKQIRDWASQRGKVVYQEYSDVESGSKASRPAWDRLLQDMRRNRFDTIVVTKLDRVGRSLQHVLSLFEEFKNLGVHFVATTQNIDTSSASGRLQLQIIGAFAEWERNLISERTKEALKGNKRVGKRGKDKKPRKKRGGVRKPLSLNSGGGS